MNASAKDLAREAMLYDEIGHRREALQLLRHAGRVCPQAPEISRVAAKLERPANPNLAKFERVGCRVMDWLYLPAVIGRSVGPSYLLPHNLVLPKTGRACSAQKRSRECRRKRRPGG